MEDHRYTLSIVLPARNEAASLPSLLAKLTRLYPNAEIVVVDDGSTDGTASLCRRHGVTLVQHPHGLGNGAAIKSGVRAARGEVLVFMDADGQHDPSAIATLLDTLDRGYEMVVGARDRTGQASWARGLANGFYNRLATWMSGTPILDLTSGFRAVRAERFREFLYLLPNTFSYPTTSTMAFLRSGYPVAFVPISVGKRVGRSHIQPLRDGLRFFLIIFKIGSLYSPLKLFVPVALSFFSLGLGYYAYTFLTAARFTNMSALLFTTSVLIFLIGLISEQITNLLYFNISQASSTVVPVSRARPKPSLRRQPSELPVVSKRA